MLHGSVDRLRLLLDGGRYVKDCGWLCVWMGCGACCGWKGVRLEKFETVGELSLLRVLM